MFGSGPVRATMDLGSLFSGLAGAAYELFGYNRKNFQYDRRQRTIMEYQLSDRPEREKTKRGDFAPARPKNKSQWEDRDLPFWPSTTWESEQALGLWRDDVRDAVELTPKKMEVYLLVISLELTAAACCLCKGRIPPGAPPWMVAAGVQSSNGLEDGDVVTAVARRARLAANLSAFVLIGADGRAEAWGGPELKCELTDQRGAVVNVSSQSSTRVFPAHTSYSVSKAAIDQVTRHLAVELGPHGIRCNAVKPTVVRTEMGKTAWPDGAPETQAMLSKIPLGRFAEPEEIASVVAFLLDERRSGMVNGACIPVDGDCSGVQEQLTSVEQIQSTGAAFAALKTDGSRLARTGVQQIQATRAAFAAVLRTGRVVTWGCPQSGGDSRDVQDRLRNVQQIQASTYAFAALTAAGEVVTWGGDAGDSVQMQGKLRQVQQMLGGVRWRDMVFDGIQASGGAFAAILQDGSVVTWGDPDKGGNSSHVQAQLVEVQQIQASRDAFAALCTDGRVVTWGSQRGGGDCGRVKERLKDVQQIQATTHAFAALLGDGSVVAWGGTKYGGSRGEEAKSKGKGSRRPRTAGTKDTGGKGESGSQVLAICSCISYLLLALWFGLHAFVAAQAYKVRILTQLVRLPIPSWTHMEAARTYGSDFESMRTSQMLRVPVVGGSQDRPSAGPARRDVFANCLDHSTNPRGRRCFPLWDAMGDDSMAAQICERVVHEMRETLSGHHAELVRICEEMNVELSALKSLAAEPRLEAVRSDELPSLGEGAKIPGRQVRVLAPAAPALVLPHEVHYDAVEGMASGKPEPPEPVKVVRKSNKSNKSENSQARARPSGKSGQSAGFEDRKRLKM
eukprot:g29278.t1